ncbi:MAG: hypothetical protein Q9219_001610 [cf. Caloplaca sp. 3 TL-2023]
MVTFMFDAFCENSHSYSNINARTEMRLVHIMATMVFLTLLLWYGALGYAIVTERFNLDSGLIFFIFVLPLYHLTGLGVLTLADTVTLMVMGWLDCRPHLVPAALWVEDDDIDEKEVWACDEEKGGNLTKGETVRSGKFCSLVSTLGKVEFLSRISGRR